MESLRRLDRRGARCEVLTQVGPNPSRNRNHGVAKARAAVLAFTDDDCEVAPDWIASAAAFFRAHPDYDVVGGPQLTLDDGGIVARASGHALASRFGAYRQSTRYRRAPSRLAATQLDLSSANLFITKRAFVRWGPFDERLWPNEETALLGRIEAGSGKIAYDPTIIVFHKRRGSLWALARQCFGYGRGRARQSRLEGSWMPGLGQIVPGAFLAYLTLLPLLAPSWPATLLPLAIYALAAVSVSLATAVLEADAPALLVMPLAFLAIHTAYPAGYVVETLRMMLAPARARWPAESTAAVGREAVTS